MTYRQLLFATAAVGLSIGASLSLVTCAHAAPTTITGAAYTSPDNQRRDIEPIMAVNPAGHYVHVDTGAVDASVAQITGEAYNPTGQRLSTLPVMFVDPTGAYVAPGGGGGGGPTLSANQTWTGTNTYSVAPVLNAGQTMGNNTGITCAGCFSSALVLNPPSGDGVFNFYGGGFSGNNTLVSVGDFTTFGGAGSGIVNVMQFTGAETGTGTEGVNWIIFNPTITTTGSSPYNAISIAPNGTEIAHWDMTGHIKAVLATATGSYVCASGGVMTVEASACPASDVKQKNPIGFLTPAEASHKLDQLNAFTYTYKDPETYGKGERVGLYAQDVCAMDERACSRDDKGEISTYDERAVIAYLIADRKTLEARIAVLERKARHH